MSVPCLWERPQRKEGAHIHNPLSQDFGIHSTYWIWRSYHKDQWTGFEMVRRHPYGNAIRKFENILSSRNGRQTFSFCPVLAERLFDMFWWPKFGFRSFTTNLIPLSWKRWQMHGRNNRGNIHEEDKLFYVTFDEDIVFSDKFKFFMIGERWE